jgi:hypothetical protein
VLTFPATAAAQDPAIASVPRETPLAADSGCLLYNAWDGAANRERKLTNADSPRDSELAGAGWRDELVFAAATPRAAPTSTSAR